MRKLFVLAAVWLMGGCSSTTTTVTDNLDAGTDAATPATDSGAPGRDAATQCVPTGGDCSTGACCAGHTCVSDTKEPSRSICASNCLDKSQCNTGCCTTLVQGTSSVCAPTSYCAAACVKPGGDCSLQTGGKCCSDSVCVVSQVDGTVCAARCSGHDQCSSLCCAPLSNSSDFVCSPPSFCM